MKIDSQQAGALPAPDSSLHTTALPCCSHRDEEHRSSSRLRERTDRAWPCHGVDQKTAPSTRGFTAPNIRYLCSKKAGGKGENWALGRARCSADAHPAATTTQARTLLKLFLLVHQDQALQCAQVTWEGPKDAVFASTSHEPGEGGTDLKPWARNSSQGLELLPCTPGGLKMLQTIPVHAKAEQILATPASPPSCPTSTGHALPEGQSRRRGQKHLQQQGHLQEHLQGPGTSPRALRVCPILGQFLCTNNLPW